MLGTLDESKQVFLLLTVFLWQLRSLSPSFSSQNEDKAYILGLDDKV